MTKYVVLVIFAIFLVTLVTRAIPFVFTGFLTKNSKIQVLGPKLPAYIMLLLVIYEINPGDFFKSPYNLPEIISLLLLIFTHKLIKRPLLSMFIGTAFYIFIQNYI